MLNSSRGCMLPNEIKILQVKSSVIKVGVCLFFQSDSCFHEPIPYHSTLPIALKFVLGALPAWRSLPFPFDIFYLAQSLFSLIPHLLFIQVRPPRYHADDQQILSSSQLLKVFSIFKDKTNILGIHVPCAYFKFYLNLMYQLHFLTE